MLSAEGLDEADNLVNQSRLAAHADVQSPTSSKNIVRVHSVYRVLLEVASVAFNYGPLQARAYVDFGNTALDARPEISLIDAGASMQNQRYWNLLMKLLQQIEVKLDLAAFQKMDIAD
jgi:hypothetical protein